MSGNLPVTHVATFGLILTGGGARAAYQVGTLRALAELTKGTPNPFPVITGVSAGAINGAALASHGDDFQGSVEKLAETWLSLTPERVYRTDVLSIASIGGRWIRNLTSGGLATSISHAYTGMRTGAPPNSKLLKPSGLIVSPKSFRSGGCVPHSPL